MAKGGDKNPTRAALESKKTMSRRLQDKLASQVSSRATSNAGSNPASRAQSRQVSDDEDGYMSDSTNAMSTTSGMDHDQDFPDPGLDGFKLLLEEIIERKGSTHGGREIALRRYNTYLARHVASDQVEAKCTELIASFLKSIRNHDSELEVCLAMKAIAITQFSTQYEDEDIFRVLKQQTAPSDDSSPAVRETAIHALAAAVAYGGAGEEEIGEIMDYFIEMLTDEDMADKRSDGPFAAACKEWAFLATYLDDIQDRTEDAVIAFSRQLNNNDTEVLVATGDAIALIYEKSHTEREADDPPPTKEQMRSLEDRTMVDLDLRYVQRYPIFEDFLAQKELSDRVMELAMGSRHSLHASRHSSKNISKKFRDVLETTVHPARGPGWRNAVDQETGRQYGHSIKHRMGSHGYIYVTRWWEYLRYDALKRTLAGGDFLDHYENNPNFFETLPLTLKK